MIKLSELISKEIVSIYECQSIGTICGIVTNKNFTKIDGFIFFDDENDNDNYISSNKIYSLSEEGVFVRNTSKIETNINANNSLINKKAFNITGKFLGKISDIIINDKCEILYLQTNFDQKIYVKNIINYGDEIVLLKDDDCKISLSNFKPKENFDNLSYNDVTVKVVPIEPENEQKRPSFPAKVVANSNCLIGRKAKSTLIGLNNEIIVKENQVINESILKSAKKHNKMAQLLYITN